MKKYQYILYILFLFGCSKGPKVASDQLDNFYYVKIGNVALPVRVTGNINADVAIVFVHGGPGGTAQIERANIYWKELEKNYKIIYYDQRGSGTTQGNTAIEDMTIEQFAEDLDHIVDFTKQVAKVNTIFIHGASWGGGLTTYYLLDTAHQKKINGAIIESPAYDLVNGATLSASWMTHKADSMIALANNLPYWQNCKAFYQYYQPLTKNEFKQHQNYLNQVNGIASNTTNIALQNVSIPKSEIYTAYNNAEFAPNTLTYRGESIFKNMDLTNQLNQIQIPVLLVWGELDGLLPRHNLAKKFYDNLGTPSKLYDANKYKLSAHLPHAEEWQQFQIDAIAFYEANK